MQSAGRKSFFQVAAKPALAGVLAVFVLFFSTLAASSSLHQLVHHDAGAPNHSCVITLFATGQIDSAPAFLMPAVIAALLGALVLLPETVELPSADYRYSSSRAPPSSVLFI
jgi:hypothetical protein